MSGSRFWEVAWDRLPNKWRNLSIAAGTTPHLQKWMYLVGCYNSGVTLLLSR